MNIFKRTRDVMRNFRPIERISFQDWQLILDRYNKAKAFISDENPLYVILKSDLDSSRDILIENRTREVHEKTILTKGFSKTFITPKKEQVEELTGKYKYIKGYLSEVQSWIDRKESLEKREADGNVTIQRESVEKVQA